MSDQEGATAPTETSATAPIETSASGETAQTEVLGAGAARVSTPRTRWGAIVWGAIVAVVATVTLIVIGSPGRRLAVANWLADLTPGTVWIFAVLVVGVIILVLALLALVRRAQRRRTY